MGDNGWYIYILYSDRMWQIFHDMQIHLDFVLAAHWFPLASQAVKPELRIHLKNGDAVISQIFQSYFKRSFNFFYPKHVLFSKIFFFTNLKLIQEDLVPIPGLTFLLWRFSPGRQELWERKQQNLWREVEARDNFGNIFLGFDATTSSIWGWYPLVN